MKTIRITTATGDEFTYPRNTRLLTPSYCGTLDWACAAALTAGSYIAVGYTGHAIVTGQNSTHIPEPDTVKLVRVSGVCEVEEGVESVPEPAHG